MAVSRVLDRVGQVLGGRYRLLAPIGSGASASVYLADDAVLRRRVAVKVLHAALADDEAFLRRFRAEAHAAAALNHPHVMAVYDWGQDSGGDDEGSAGIPYLVTEYLAGGSLRGMLDQGRLLSSSQALLVGLETARGLEYAHRRGFVHRDIKPANLLFDEEARLRIADFGLARALAEAAWTEPMGAVLGTARYASPEQARGESLDGKSDVYSLALVIIEAVTGTVPFSADTTIGTLMARVNQPLVVPEALGALAGPLRWAGNPDPKRRPDASEFGAALMAAASGFDRPAPLALAGTRSFEEDASLGSDPTETTPLDPATAEPTETTATTSHPELGDAAVPEGPDGIVILRDDEPRRGGFFRNALPMTAPARWGESDQPDALGDVAEATHRHPAVAPTTGIITAPAFPAEGPAGHNGDGHEGYDTYDRSATSVIDEVAGYDDAYDELSRRDARRARRDAKKHAVRYDRHGRPHPRRRRWPLVALALLLAVSAGSAAGYGYWYYNVRIPLYQVPVLVGRNVADVDALVSPYRWTVERQERFDDTIPVGQILDQQPAVATEVPRGGAITITISAGRPPVDVPTTLVGKTLEQATEALGAIGLGVGKVEQQFDETQPADVVLALAPGTPAQVKKGDDVALIVSAGPRPRVIPDGLVGKPSTSAIAALKALGLVPRVTEEFSDSIVAGNVISIDPGVGKEAARGSTVELIISKGPPLVEVPDVAGLTVEAAATKLEAAGFTVNDVKGNPRRKIDHTDPVAGTKVKPGTKITLFTEPDEDPEA